MTETQFYMTEYSRVNAESKVFVNSDRNMACPTVANQYAGKLYGLFKQLSYGFVCRYHIGKETFSPHETHAYNWLKSACGEKLHQSKNNENEKGVEIQSKNY